MLTDTAVKAAKPQAKPYKLSDERGLFLLVTPAGGKWWRLKYRVGGKEKLLSLGTYPDVGLKEARARRDEARKLKAAGVDPGEARKAEKKAAAAATDGAFEVVAREWHTKASSRWAPHHAADVWRSLEREVFPTLGHRPITSITAPEVLAVLRPVEARGALELAGRLRQRIGGVFRYGIATGLCTYNPATDLRGALAAPKVTHRAALAAADMPEFMKKLAAYDGHPVTKAALRLALLTAARTLELRGAEWAEIDEESATWRVPAARMKTKAEHLIPLSPQALAVLAELRPLTGAGRYLFPHESNPTKVMSQNTMLYALYRLGYHGRATIHGLRALFSTVANEAGKDPDVIERHLAHVERNKVRAAYHRAEYLPQRRELMQWWGRRIDDWEHGASVLALRAHTYGIRSR